MKFYVILFFIVSSCYTHGQQKGQNERIESKSSLLWKISGPSTKDSYLFGTMHLMEREHFYFPKKLEKTLNKSDVLVMELPGIPKSEEALEFVLLEEGSFFDYFSSEQTDSIFVWAKRELKMEETSFRKFFSGMKPFTMVQFSVQLKFMGKTESYEITFERLAKNNEIPIEGLETIADQMALFDNLTPEQQTEMVMETIRDNSKSIKLIQEMQEIYLRQDVEELYRLIADEGGVIAEEQNKFLDERNQNWIPKIINSMSEKKTFFAVGSGHLGGPNGVISLLRKEGYTLTPIEL